MFSKCIVLCYLASLIPAVAQAQLTCQASAVPGTLRAEGLAELLPDVVLQCSGGVPAKAGALLPQYSIVITANGTFANNPLPDPTQSLQPDGSILLIDDPAPGQQTACVPPVYSNNCANVSGSPGPNVFAGRQVQDNTLTFQYIPIDSPAASQTRTIRITNLRIAGPQIIQQTPAGQVPQVKLSLQMFSGAGVAVPLGASPLTVAGFASSYTFSARTANDGAVTGTDPALLVSPSQLSQTLPNAASSFLVKFSELLPNAFRRRNIATSASDPSYVVSQSLPGAAYSTETGFYNSLFPLTANMNVAGLADSGTRLRVAFQDIPAGVLMWVSVRDVQPGTTGYSDSAPKAMLTATDDSGAGPFSYEIPTQGGWSQLMIQNGAANCVWEVVSADPTALETFAFSVALTAQTNGSVGLGTAHLTGALAPSATVAPFPYPGFLTVPVQQTAFTLSTSLPVAQFSSISAASFSGSAVAPGSLISGFGTGLSTATEAAVFNLPTVLAGTNVDIIDSAGAKLPAQLMLVTPGQINYYLDPNTRTGIAVVSVSNGGRIVASGSLQVNAVAPGIFSANGNGAGAPAGQVFYSSVGNTRYELLAQYNDTTQLWSTAPIDLASADSATLILYGTGVRGSTVGVTAQVGGVSVPVSYAGIQSMYTGLDQVNVGPLPKSLAGKGNVDLVVTVDGKPANTLSVNIK